MREIPRTLSVRKEKAPWGKSRHDNEENDEGKKKLKSCIFIFLQKQQKARLHLFYSIMKKKNVIVGLRGSSESFLKVKNFGNNSEAATRYLENPTAIYVILA